MAIKTILTEPNKILRQISKPVVNVGKEEQSLMKDMRKLGIKQKLQLKLILYYQED